MISWQVAKRREDQLDRVRTGVGAASVGGSSTVSENWRILASLRSFSTCREVDGKDGLRVGGVRAQIGLRRYDDLFERHCGLPNVRLKTTL